MGLAARVAGCGTERGLRSVDLQWIEVGGI